MFAHRDQNTQTDSWVSRLPEPGKKYTQAIKKHFNLIVFQTCLDVKADSKCVWKMLGAKKELNGMKRNVDFPVSGGVSGYYHHGN